MNRRTFLLAATSVPPILSFLSPGFAFAQLTETTDFMKVSVVLVGRKDLSPDIGLRIERLLKSRIDGYGQKLAHLSQTLAPAVGDLTRRNELLKALSEDDTNTAVEVVRPWYVGYVGQPSDAILKDDAVFVTYLDAQAYDIVRQELPRNSYPLKGQGWWEAVPNGVTARPMPERVTDWTWQPDGATGAIAQPDPAWRAYAIGDYATLAAARAALSDANGTTPIPDTANPW